MRCCWTRTIRSGPRRRWPPSRSGRTAVRRSASRAARRARVRSIAASTPRGSSSSRPACGRGGRRERAAGRLPVRRARDRRRRALDDPPHARGAPAAARLSRDRARGGERGPARGRRRRGRAVPRARRLGRGCAVPAGAAPAARTSSTCSGASGRSPGRSSRGAPAHAAWWPRSARRRTVAATSGRGGSTGVWSTRTSRTPRPGPSGVRAAVGADGPPVFVVRNGVARPEGPERIAPSADPPVLLCVGNISENKGQDLLLEAVRRLQARWPGLRATLVGRDSHRRTVLPGRGRARPRRHVHRGRLRRGRPPAPRACDARRAAHAPSGGHADGACWRRCARASRWWRAPSEASPRSSRTGGPVCWCRRETRRRSRAPSGACSTTSPCAGVSPRPRGGTSRGITASTAMLEGHLAAFRSVARARGAGSAPGSPTWPRRPCRCATCCADRWRRSGSGGTRSPASPRPARTRRCWRAVASRTRRCR